MNVPMFGVMGWVARWVMTDVLSEPGLPGRRRPAGTPPEARNTRPRGPRSETGPLSSGATPRLRRRTRLDPEVLWRSDSKSFFVSERGLNGIGKWGADED